MNTHASPRYAHQIWDISGISVSLVDKYGSGTYLAITCQVKVAFGCVLAYICEKCRVYMPIKHVRYTWNVASLFIQ